MEPAQDTRPIALQGGQDKKTRSHAREAGVDVGRVFVRDHAALFEELTHVASPHAEKGTHMVAAPGRHAAKARQAATSQHVQGRTLDQIVRSVRKRNHVSPRLGAGTIQEGVTQRSCRGLERALRERLGPALGDHGDAEAGAHRRHLSGDLVRAFAERVVEVRGDYVTAGFMERQEKRGRIGAARNRDEDSRGGELSHGGAGWTRTSDNAIMSRALYHLSYGTAAPTLGALASCLGARLQLLLLLPVLRDRDALSLVHFLPARMRGWGLGSEWLRRSDSNRRPSGYEPDELPLLHSAM